MTRVGYFLSCEEYTPKQLLKQAKMAEHAGFDALWISDHFHPWNDAQGQSAFVWSLIGGLAQTVNLPITTAVTCPTVRLHPGIIAQAAATSAVLLDGRFRLGVGSGEALNEHIFGDRWPPAEERLGMLTEAVEVIRLLFEGGVKDHHGKHYTLENARLYTLPEQPVPIYVSGFGPKAAQLAGRIGDGYISTMPDPELLKAFRSAGGQGKPTQAGYKVCWARDRQQARRTAHRLWANDKLPGELAQELPTPEHFEQASTLVTEEMVGEALACGDDVDEHLNAMRAYIDVGYDEVYVNQIGDNHEGFFAFYRDQVLPKVVDR
jgi:G6PDH family F420-dependent oxidoreductase